MKPSQWTLLRTIAPRLANSNNFPDEVTERNQEVFGDFAGIYAQSGLMPTERDFLNSFKPRWHKVSILDLGVGAGRTAVTFSKFAKSYVALDYSAQMVARCREALPESPTTRVVLGDAGDLSFLGEEKFDIVLFSWNGIDYVSPEHRRRILTEVRRVLRDSESRFYFSTHSLTSLPFRRAPFKFDSERPVNSVLNVGREWKKYLRLRWLNRSLDLAQAKKQGFAYVQDSAHRFGLLGHYIMPEYQCEQLRQCGFRVEKLSNREGETVTPSAPGKSSWHAYVCSPLP